MGGTPLQQNARQTFAVNGEHAWRLDGPSSQPVALSPEEAERIRNLAPVEQIPEILELEEQGIFFSKDLSKSTVYSVAPPGTSQHLSLLAFDINEYNDPIVKAILAKHGWFQTVVSDLPHFTYLGFSEKELPALGLKYVISGGRSYWIPKL